MHSIAEASNMLKRLGVAHVKVLANAFGREQYTSLRINLNKKGQASEYWLAFLRKFKISTVPEKLSGVHAGVFKYVYCNRDRTVCIWLQTRPDQNTVKPGHAGTTVLRVEDHAPFTFQQIKRELARISNVQIKIIRRPRYTLPEQEQPTKPHTKLSPVNDQTQHETTLKTLRGKRFNDFDAFMKKYYTGDKEK